MNASFAFLTNSVEGSTVVNGATNAIIYAVWTEKKTTNLTDVQGGIAGKYERKLFRSDKVTVREVTTKVHEFLEGGTTLFLYGYVKISPLA